MTSTRAKALDNFRTVVLVAVVCRIASWFLSFRAQELSPKGSEAAADWIGYGSLLDAGTTFVLWYGWLAIEMLGLIGLFFFLWPARWLLLITLCTAPVLSAFTGIVVLSPVECVANALYQIAYVATMGMAFFSPAVAGRFARDARSFAAGDGRL